MPKIERSRNDTSRRRRFATVVVVAGLGLTLATFLLAQGESVEVHGVTTAFPTAVWWTSPLVVYRLLVRTALGEAVIGLASVAALVVGLVALYNTDSSTAAIGFFTIPALLWLGVIGALLVEGLLTARLVEST